jgi:fatty-acyl-CoA synthase
MSIELNLADVGRHWARWQPDELAIRFDDGTSHRDLTWRELDRSTDELAAGLAARGVTTGDRIALLMLNSTEWIEITVAAWKVGAVIVPLNVRFTGPEVAFVTRDAGCKLLVTDTALAAGTADAAADRSELVVVVSDELGSWHVEGASPPVVHTSWSDPAFLCYTSGTTGDPKGAVLTHGSWNIASQGWAQAIELRPADRVYLPFPLAFTGGLAVFLFTYWAGARLVLDRAYDPGRTIDLFEHERLTALLAVPVILQQLIDHPRAATADLSSWRVACSGGASVPGALIQAVQARGVPMLQGYSLTEASAAGTILPGPDARRKLGSAGLAIPHGRIGVVDEDGRPCQVDEVGEIVVHGLQVMSGYWNQPEATAATLRNGWLHTGDLGRLDGEGYLYVVDRAKDMLISGGLNVYPAEIERTLATLPGLLEVAVIGVPDRTWGETPAVIAVTDGRNFDAAAVLGACQGVLADYKMPRYLVVRDAPLPRNMSGKILKRELRVEYADLPETTPPIR